MARFSRQRVCATVFSMWLLQADSASALGLLQAYDAALQNDPTYRAAVYENEAGQQYKVMGRSSLLPSLSASYSSSKNQADVTSKTAFSEVTEHRSYNSMAGAIQLRQPLVHLEGVARYYQGIAQTSYSDAQFSARRQELILRLVTAYVEAKHAEELLALAIAQRDSYAEQRRMNDRMFEKGEGTRTDMLETQARSDLAEAEVLEAKDNLANTRNALAAMVGREITVLDALRDDFRVKPMQPAGFEEWKAIALEQNPEIIAQRHVVETAFQEIRKNRAGHAPRLDIIASVSDTSSDTINTYNQDAKTNSIGLQFSLPLYSGGYTSAVTSQAVSNHEKAKADLETKTNQILMELRKYYSLTLSSALRIDALVKSDSSARLLVEATQKSVKSGLRTNLDVLNAQQQLFTAKRDLSLARYNYLVGYLHLRQAAGVVGTSDLQDMAGYFITGTQ
jgi:protease secretion system outer membrane protein